MAVLPSKITAVLWLVTLTTALSIGPKVDARNIAAGLNSTCVIKDKAVYCWGANSNGQAGADPAKRKTVPNPTAIDLGTTKVPATIAMGATHACVLFTDKTGKCWGANAMGQLGNGNFKDSYKPVDIYGGSAMEDIVAGDAATCVQVTNGNVYCWGSLMKANGTTDKFNAPVLYSSGPTGPIAANPAGYCAGTSNVIGCLGSVWLSVGLKYPSQTSKPVVQYEIKGNFGSSPGVNLTMPGASGIKELGLGQNFVCAVSSGQVRCAGEYLMPWITNGFPALNNQALGLPAYPQLSLVTPILMDALHLSTGPYHACAVRQNGQVSCWGADWTGVLGQGAWGSWGSATAVTVPGLSDVAEVASGRFHVCALTQSGDVLCWGSVMEDAIGPASAVPNKATVAMNNFCGEGKQTCSYAAKPVKITGWTNAASPATAQKPVACDSEWYYAKDSSTVFGPYHGCQDIPDAIDNDPQMWCATLAGYFAGKQYGTNWTYCANGGADKCVKDPWLFVNAKGFPPGPYTGCSNPDKDAVGDWCPTQISYVANNGGGTQWDHCSPAASSLPGLTPPADVAFKEPPAQKNTLAVGDEFSCVLKDGAIQCVGKNTYGQLGNGQTTSKPVTKPVTVALPAGAKPISISAGISNACAILSDQSLQCWGANAYGQLGNGTTKDSAAPVAVSGLGPAVRVALGGSSTCAVTPAGLAYCWGGGGMGQLGIGSNPFKSLYPTKVSGMSGVLDVGLGMEFGCALHNSGQVYCWGNNSYGQLGKGDKLPSNVPVAVKDGTWYKPLTGVTSLSVGATHACALLTDKTGRCWGNNAKGQLGVNQNDAAPVTVAKPIFGGSAMEEIVAYGSTTCTRVTNGSVYCWGDNSSGQFGNNSTGYATAPVLAFNGHKASALGVGSHHVCITMASSGITACKGSDDLGQLKLDPTKTKPPPSAADALAKMIDLHHQMVAAIPPARAANTNFSTAVRSAMDPAITDLLAGKSPPKIASNAATVQLQKDAATAAAKPPDLLQQMAELFVGLFPPEGVGQPYGSNINETYAQAAGIFMSALISQAYDWPEQKPNCTTTLIEQEELLEYLTSFSKDVPKAASAALSSVTSMQCLSPEVAADLGSAIYSSYKAVTNLIGKWRPAYAQPVKDALLTRLAVLLFPLEDITRSRFPDDPALLMLGQYVARLNAVPWNKKVNDYGIDMYVPFLYLRDPSKALYQNWYGIPGIGIPLCPSAGGSDIAAQLPKPKTGDGEKTLFGADVADVDAQTCGNPSKTWPVWNGNPDNVYQGCLIFKHYANMAVNTVLLSNGTCRDWNTSRIGKGCCVPVKPKTSRLEKNVPASLRSGLARLWESLSNLWISTAYAQGRASPWFQRGAPPAPAVAPAPAATRTAPVVAVPNDPYALPQDPYAGTFADAVCPKDRCYPENGELVFKGALGAERRYPGMTREKFIALQQQRVAESKAVEKARAEGVEALRTHLFQTAPLVIRGTPTAQSVETPKGEMRRTLYTVTVAEVLRGKVEQAVITVVVPGGCASPADCETVMGLRTPKVNQEAIFLLHPVDKDRWGVVELGEGVFRVENGRLPDWNIDLPAARERSKAPPAPPAPTAPERSR